MNLVAGLALGSALMANLTIELPEGKQLTVVNDPYHPFAVAHELQVNVFLGSGGEGVVRMHQQVPGVHGVLNEGPLTSWWDDEKRYEIEVLELVGIATSPKPQIYLVNSERVKLSISFDSDKSLQDDIEHWQTSMLARLKQLPKTPRREEQRKEGKITIREPDWFETASIKQLQTGSSMIMTRDGELWRGVGAIRALNSCLRCHDNHKEGDLLGAFTYFVKTSPLKVDELLKPRHLLQLVESKATSEQLWAALGDSPRPLDELFPQLALNLTPDRQLDVALARKGIVQASLLKHVVDERATLEKKHMVEESAPKKPTSSSPKSF
jgi:hypothetical protein